MIRVAIWGNNAVSSAAKKIIEEEYNRRVEAIGGELLKVVAFIGNRSEGDEVSAVDILSLSEYMELYKQQDIPFLLIPIDNYCIINPLITDLVKSGMDLNDIYCCNRITVGITEDEQKINSFITPYLSTSYLPYLEFHVADHCNLNCKACEHYSGLVQEERFPDFDKFTKDFQKLKGFVNDIGMIRVMGGEPLLNKELSKYLRLVRAVYPFAVIQVVTNALLIKSMKPELIETMKREKIAFSISFYPPLERQMEGILQFLDEQGITYVTYPMSDKFTKKQTLKPHSDQEMNRIFYSCMQAHCHNLYDGKLATCFLPFTTKYFNQYFNVELPEDGFIDLYNEKLTLEEIKLKMLIPFERCRYCTDPEEIEWGIIQKPSCLDDWIVSKG